MGAFHAYDIRGIYGVDFNKDTAYKVGYFVPGLLGADRVVVGRDCRVSSQEIHDALVKGIKDAGADVFDLGLSSTPMVYFATANYGFKASVQITASHNPAEYNGMKVSRENALPVGLENGLGKIQKWIEEGKPTPVSSRPGRIHPMDIMNDYMKFMERFRSDLSNIRIAFDLSNGMSTLFAKRVFGDTPSYIFDDMDGRFPNHEPNPLIHKNVEPLENLVRKTGSDVGVIFDGDADRVMFVDDKGKFVAPDLIIALLSKYFIGKKEEKNPVVLQEIRSSKAVSEYLTPLGADVQTWKVGRAYAAPKLREIGGLWGGELAGHYYFKDFFYSDSGLLTSLLVLGIVSDLKKEGKTLSETVSDISAYRNSGEINFKLDDKQGAMKAVCDLWSSEEKPLKIMDFDGFRLEFKDWWFNIRPSNTEPLLRFICEATSDELLQDRVTRTENLLTTKFNAQ